ncbi:MAG: site-2 protease family protein [candidate division WOR-3 bacterium]|nr:site-2 protease family protein [candidate division WOR-3 bacterium]MCX7948088.1 site-2 protease family protein [candidate division WOR-3 bacterium]MDW8150974.1 site-2 protease family protein [candidate division WOR-3 bacterium]
MSPYYILSKYTFITSIDELEHGFIAYVSIPYDVENRISALEDELIKNGYYLEVSEEESNNFILKITKIPKPQKQNYLLHLILFILTIISTLIAGAIQAGANPFSGDIIKGIPFSISIMSILLFHEMGHFILSKKYKVDATLPYFIPFPNPLIGTMGAVIKIRSAIPNRKALLHIGAAGPWFGLIVTIAVLVVGLKLSKVVDASAAKEGIMLGESILFKTISYLVLGNTEDKTIILHPIAFAGWLGLFVTNLNLIPIGQLDGGHIAYALFGKNQKYISFLFLIVLLFFGIFYWSGWFIWAILALILGINHPKPLNDYTKLNPKDKLYATLSIFLFILTFTPTPLKI